MLIKDKGIILKETIVGEADKILTVLLYGRGKISVSARGARKPGSKFLSAAQPFCLADFVIYAGNGFYAAAQIDLIESFYKLRDDYDMYRYASFFAEMTDKMILPDMPAENALVLLATTFYAIVRGAAPLPLISAAFQFKFLQLEGYAPETGKCAVCGGREAAGSGLFFGAEGIVCENCGESPRVKEHKRYPVRISETTRYAIEYILNTDIKKLYNFTLSEKETGAIYEAAGVFRDCNIDAEFKSLELL